MLSGTDREPGILQNENDSGRNSNVVIREIVLTQHKKARLGSFFPSWKHFVEPLKSPLGYELAGQGMLTPRFGTPTAGSNFDSAYQVSMYEEHLARIGARQGWLRQLRFRKWL